MEKALSRFLSLVLALLVFCGTTADAASNSEKDTQKSSAQSDEILSSQDSSSISYQEYINQYKDAATPETIVNVNIGQFVCTSGNARISKNLKLDGVPSVETTDTGSVTWKLHITEGGLYNIRVAYYPIAGKKSSIIRQLAIDGKLPFSEADNITFSRIYANGTGGGTFKKDPTGNDIRPEQVEVLKWQQVDLYDVLGYNTSPLRFYFSKGDHTLTFNATKETLAIGSIQLYQAAKPVGYASVHKQDEANGRKDTTGFSTHIQGEAAVYKSTNMAYPINDNSSPATEPSSATRQLLNTVGGAKWENNQEWLEWTFTVPSDGYYEIGIKARQDINAGQASYRKLYIDGKVPFSEMEDVKFNYSSGWQMVQLADSSQTPYRFYLTKGKHLIRLEATLGELSTLVRRVYTCMETLMSIYRDFLMVIGENADTTRDYQFTKILPEDIAGMKKQSAELRDIYWQFKKINSTGGTQSVILQNIINIVDEMYKRPDRIASLYSDFSTDISALGTWYSTAKTMPLEVDYIQIKSPDQSFSKPNATFASYMGFIFKQFAASFYRDYSTVSQFGTNKKSISVWISTGMDQAKALGQLIQNDFTSRTSIGVDLQLVATGTLLTATLAHRGPDVALTEAQSEPMNYAIRGAVLDLTQFRDYREVEKRFQSSALVPLTFNGHLYGLPETQSFYMMFYRTDIMKNLGLDIPQTWDDVIAMLPVLQKRNMNFALPVPYSQTTAGLGLPVYATFLYQYGGSFYLSGGSKTALDSVAATDAFYDWTGFYTDYTLPKQYDFLTRFRTGQVPIGVVDYSTYNSLSVFAPELNGVWKMAMVPGTRRADGSIDRSVASTITASVIMNGTRDKQSAWTFLKWWTSASAQEQYGDDIESIQGTAGRYQTANVEALYKIPWKTADFNMLMKQWKWSKGIPEVPGSYMTSRYIDFAFKQVVLDNSADPGKVLQNENALINNELSVKRAEFGLSSNK